MGSLFSVYLFAEMASWQRDWRNLWQNHHKTATVAVPATAKQDI